MSFNTVCPHCGSKLRLLDKYAGLPVKCPDCDKKHIAGRLTSLLEQQADSEEPDAKDGDVDQQDADEEHRRKKLQPGASNASRSSSTLLIILLATGGLALVGVAGMVLFVVSHRQGEAKYKGKSTTEWVRTLEDKDPRTRQTGVVALGMIGSSDEPRVIPALIQVLQRDDMSDIRAEAAKALGGSSGIMGSHPEVIAALLAAMNDDHSDVRKAAAETLGLMTPAISVSVAGADATIRTLSPIAIKDADDDVRSAAVCTLAQLGEFGAMGGKDPQEIVEVLTEALEDRNELARGRAELGLRHIESALPENLKGKRGHVAKKNIRSVEELIFDARDLYKRFASNKEQTKKELGGKIVTVKGTVMQVHADKPFEYIAFSLDCAEDRTHGQEKIIAIFRTSKDRPFSLPFVERVDRIRKGLESTGVTVRGRFKVAVLDGKEFFSIEDAKLLD